MPASMRVAFVADKSGPFYVGGYEDRLWNLARRMARTDEVRVFSSSSNFRSDSPNLSFVDVCAAPRSQHGTTARSLSHSLRFSASCSFNFFHAWRPDAIYVESIPYLHLPLLGRWIPSTGARTVLNVDEVWTGPVRADGVPTGVLRVLVPRLLQIGIDWSDTVLAASKVTAQSLRREYPGDSIASLPSGVDLQQVREVVRSFKSDKSFDVAYLGRLVRIKRVDDLVSALLHLRDAYGWLGRAVIIGDGPEKDVLARRVRSAGLAESIRFAGYVTESEKYRLLLSSRVFVLPSEREGLSISTVQAMACGLPAIVARPFQPNLFGVSELVEEGANGFYYPVGDVEKLADNIRTLLVDDALRQRMGSVSRDIASRYDWDALADRLRDILS